MTARRTERGASRAGCLIAVAASLLVIFGGAYGLFRLGIGWVEDEVRDDLAGGPVVLEHLGAIEELEMDFQASGALPGEEDFAFRVRGLKGAGLIRATVVAGDDDLKHVTAATLELDGGPTWDLFPAAGRSPGSIPSLPLWPPRRALPAPAGTRTPGPSAVRGPFTSPVACSSAGQTIAPQTARWA